MRTSRKLGVYAGGGFSAGSFTYTGKSRYTDEGSGNWRLELLTSGTLTLRRSVAADVFLVGGGGGGGYDGSGGGGGYTATEKAIRLAAGTGYAVTVGAGGAGQAAEASNGKGADGGTTGAFGKTVAGGSGGWGSTRSYDTRSGGAGGSGGGAFAFAEHTELP